MLRSSVSRQRAFLRMWWAVQGAVTGRLGHRAGRQRRARRRAARSRSAPAFLLFQYVLLLSRPLEDLVHQLETVQKANGAMVRVIDLLAVEPTIVDRGTDVAAAWRAAR